MKFNSAVPKLFRSAQAEQPRIPASRLHGAQRPREGWDSGWDAVEICGKSVEISICAGFRNTYPVFKYGSRYLDSLAVTTLDSLALTALLQLMGL